MIVAHECTHAKLRWDHLFKGALSHGPQFQREALITYSEIFDIPKDDLLKHAPDFGLFERSFRRPYMKKIAL